MTAERFNIKYGYYLEKGHYGLAVDIPELVGWLDKKFLEFIEIPGFQYSQIKSKYGYGRFYCKGLSPEQIEEVESKITELCRKKK